MSYRTYTTEAIVCGTYRHNTDDCSYLLFTRAHGMVFATARSARAEKSRQRYALQDFTHINVSLVKGRAGWRVGSVEAKQNYFTPLATRQGRAAAVSVVTMARRLVIGEEAYPALFDDTAAALNTLRADEARAADISELYTLRALWRLGYVKPEETLAAVLTETYSFQAGGAPPSAALQKAITHGLSLSHL